MNLKRYGKGHEHAKELDRLPAKYWIGILGLTGLTYLALILSFILTN